MTVQKMFLKTFLLKNWFLCGIILVILFAKVAPNVGAKGGFLKPELTVKYIAVFVIFFNSGLSIKTEELKRGLLQFKIHIFVQGFTFGVFPLLIYIIVSLMESGPFDDLLLQGLLVLGCMPPPVSSAVILTKAAAGNEAAAIFNSAFGSFLGTVITPTLILSVVGSSVDVPISAIFSQLSMTVVLPIILGQLIRNFFRIWLERAHIPFGSIGSAILLLIIYTTFCDTFSHEEINIDAINLMSIVFLIIILQTILLASIFYISSKKELGFLPSDTVALMFCCTHKSLTLGIPIIKIIFSGDPGLSIISIPLLVYHPTQILLGGLLVPTVKAWRQSAENYRYLYGHPHTV